MLNKFLLSGLLFTSSLALMSAANAGFEDDGNTLRISVRKLKSGSKNGEISVQGTKCSVVNLTPAFFNLIGELGEKEKLVASKREGVFYFSRIIDGGFEMKKNLETQQLEPDYDKPLPGITIFDLAVKPLSGKTTVDSKSETVAPITTALSTMKLEEKKEEKKSSVSSSVTVSQVDMVEFGGYSGKDLVLTGEQLERGLQTGKLVTNYGTFSVAQAPHSYTSFSMLYDKSRKFTGSESNGTFSFSHMEGGGPTLKQNLETQQWEYDYNNMMPSTQVFSLIVKKID